MTSEPTVATDAEPHAHPYAVPVGAIVAAAFVVLDQATKELAERFLERGRFVPFLGDSIGWELVYNPGGAFGLPAPSWIFLVVTVVVVVLVARVLPRTRSLLAASAYGLLLSGAVGNVLDRLFRPGDPDGGIGDGWVVDFVAWGGFPRFNVADSAITVGFALLVLALLLEERAERQRAAVTVAGDPVAGVDESEGRHDTSEAVSDTASDDASDEPTELPGDADGGDGGSPDDRDRPPTS